MLVDDPDIMEGEAESSAMVDLTLDLQAQVCYDLIFTVCLCDPLLSALNDYQRR